MQAVLFSAAMAAQLIGAMPFSHSETSSSQRFAKACGAAQEQDAPLMILVDDSRASNGRKITIPPYQHVVKNKNLIVCRVDVGTTFGMRLADALDVNSYPYAVVKGSDGNVKYRGAGDWVQPESQRVVTAEPESQFQKVEVAKPVVDAANHIVESVDLNNDVDAMFGESESDSSHSMDDESSISEETFVESSIDTALERAKEAKRLLVVFIKSDSCYYCVKMKQESLADEEVQATVANQFVSATIKAEDSRSFVENQGIRMFPTTLVLNSEGGLVDRLEGFVSADQLVNRLERATTTLVSQR